MTRQIGASTRASLPARLLRQGARAFGDNRDDPYLAPGKYREPTRCRVCGSVYRNGRWGSPSETGADATCATCPACRRVEDRLPAGRLTLAGEYVEAHRDQLLRIVHNVASRESSQHPLNRIMSIDVLDDRIEMCTTDVHPPRRIGRALKRAHDGELSVAFAKGACEIRVGWRH